MRPGGWSRIAWPRPRVFVLRREVRWGLEGVDVEVRSRPVAGDGQPLVSSSRRRPTPRNASSSTRKTLEDHSVMSVLEVDPLSVMVFFDNDAQGATGVGVGVDPEGGDSTRNLDRRFGTMAPGPLTHSWLERIMIVSKMSSRSLRRRLDVAKVGQRCLPALRVPFGRFLVRDARNDDHVVALVPVGGGRHLLLGGQLARIE